MATFASGTPKVVHFGQKPVGLTYVDGATEAVKKAYIARHRVNEDWGDIRTAGALSRFILWGPTRSISQNARRLGGKLA
jgi:hypothetical protein